MSYDLKPGQRVEINWIDPAGLAEWVDAQSLTQCWKVTCRAIGYVHTSDDYGVVLTASYGDDPDGDRMLLFRQHIPWACMTDVWVLECDTDPPLNRRTGG